MFSTGLSSAREGRKRLSEISWAGPGGPSCRDEPSVEHNGELSFGFAPLPRRHFPFRGDISQDEVEQFDRCFVGWKMAARFYGATQLRVRWDDPCGSGYPAVPAGWAPLGRGDFVC